MLDPNFRETLVYIAEHDENGAFGLIMNRPMGKTLGEIVDAQALSDPVAGIPVFQGGPVRPGNVLIAMFLTGETEDELVCGLDVSLEQIEGVMERGSGWVRAFVGYAGWGEGQLEGELTQEAWKVCKPDPSLFEQRFLQGLWSVFVSGDARWRLLLPFLPHNPEWN